jgi:triosephosphate isomerase
MSSILALNMKTYLTSAKDAEKVIKKIITLQSKTKASVIVCPPMPLVSWVGKMLPRKKGLALGAQDAFAGGSGAFTGTSNPELLKDLKTQYVIVGHSERRAMGESDADVNAKIRAVLEWRLEKNKHYFLIDKPLQKMRSPL